MHGEQKYFSDHGSGPNGKSLVFASTLPGAPREPTFYLYHILGQRGVVCLQLKDIEIIHTASSGTVKVRAVTTMALNPETKPSSDSSEYPRSESVDK